MSHLVLARKYRPRKLSELVGQDVFVKTISNAINAGKLHHAFLLTGTRGVGKTSSARILALSLNCKKFDKETTEPCMECECCKSILEGSNPDIVEFDAASNTGVDSMREMIDKASFAPMMSRYKVYIIDEVHMLSKSAFNALLKTLEEPPERVKFVFATTEVRKVPITILSRCQKFYLKNIPEDVIYNHLVHICGLENVSFDEQSLRLISKHANGSFRDSLSLLDQAISISNDNITFDTVKNMLSIPDRGLIAELFNNCYLGKTSDALATVENFLSNDVEAETIISELMEILLDGLKLAGEIVEKSSINNDFQEVLGKLYDQNELNIPRLLRMWQILSSSLSEIRNVGAKQYFTALIFKLCYSSTLPTPVEAIKMINDKALVDVLQKTGGKIVG